MKVLHVTNEFTKKNFSISSLIIYLSSYLYKNYKHSYSILTSSLEKNLFEKSYRRMTTNGGGKNTYEWKLVAP